MSSTPFLRLPTDGSYDGGGAKAAMNPKDELDQIAINSGVPANVILAMAEQDKVQSPDEILAVAKKAAAELGPKIKAGEPVEKVIRERFADPKQADAFINRAFDIADQYYPKKQADQPKSEGGMGAAFASGIDSLQQGYGSAVEGIGKVTGLDSVEKYGRDVAERNAKEADQNGKGLTQWDEVDGVGSAAKYAGEVAAQNAPQLGLSIGGGIAGAAAGAAVAGPPGAVVGGVLGGMGVNLPLFYGQNRERQKQSVDAGIKDHVDEGAAFLAAIPQAALDSVVDRFMVGKFLKPSALKSGGILTRAAKNAATGAIIEVPTEIGQQMIERAQAGLPLDSEDAIHEYAAAGIAAGILGVGVGGASGALNIGHGDAAPEDAPQDAPPPEAAITPPKPAGALRKAIMNGIEEAPIPARQPLREAARQAPPNASGLPEGSAIDLVMGDGTRIAATIVKEDPTKIVFANEQGDEMEIPRTEFDRGALSIEPRDGTGDVIDSTDVPDQTQAQTDTAQGDNIAIPQQAGTEGLSPAAENALDHFSERSAIIEEGDGIPRQEAALRAADQTLSYIDELAKVHGWDDSLTEVRDHLRKLVDDAAVQQQADTQAASELSTAQPLTNTPAPELGAGADADPSPAPEVKPEIQTETPKTGEKPMGEAKPTKEGEVVDGPAKPSDEDYGAAFDQAFEETMGKGDETPADQQAAPEGVDYPNRKLNMRKAKADAPIDGIGDSSPQSLGRVALSNATEGDVIPGRGTVKKVTDKQIQIEKPDGKIERISEGSDKMQALASDVGDLIGSSANLSDEKLGNLMDMIERDPALVYRDGVPQLFDDPKEQANRGERGRKKSILKPLSEKPADQEPVKKKAEEDQTDTGQSSDQEKNAPADPAKRALADAVKRGEVEHTTKRGKKLTGYVVRDMKKAQANEIDKYSFKKDGGWFIRKDDLAKAHPDLVDTGTIIEETDQSEEELQAAAEPKAAPKTDQIEINQTGPDTGNMSPERAREEAIKWAQREGANAGGFYKAPDGMVVHTSNGQWWGRNRVKKADDKFFVWDDRSLDAYWFKTKDLEAAAKKQATDTEAQPEQAAQIEDAAAQADPNPTDGQKEAGNYKMGHAAWNGLSLTIENAKGSERKGTDSNGKEWSVTMPAIYGYFKQTEGADGDHVDFYMGDVPDSDYVLIIDQAHADTAKFDEHKVIIGTKNLDEALAIYRGGFSDGKANDRISGYLETNVATLKALLDRGMMDKQLAPRDFPFKKPVPAPNAKPKGSKAAAEDRAEPAPEPQAEQDKPDQSQKLEDFGEKIGGARKHLYEEKRKILAQMDELDYENIDWNTASLSDVLPAPDFEKIHEDGDVLAETLMAVAIARASIGTKNQNSYGSWRRKVEQVSSITKDLFTGTKSINDLLPENIGYGDAFRDTFFDGEKALNNPSYLDDLVMPIMQRIEPRNMMDAAKNVTIREEMVDSGEREKSPYGFMKPVMVKTGRIQVYFNPSANAPWDYSKISQTPQEAAELINSWADLKRKRAAEKRANGGDFDFGLHVRYNSRQAFIATRKPRIVILKSFATVKDAEDYLATEDGQAELQDLAAEIRAGFDERRRDNRDRKGPNWRKGKDITEEQFSETFKFRGGQFGNSVTAKERTAFLNSTYDGLMDLAAVLGVSPETLSLDGKLGIAFGARGKGGKNPAAAHYEPGQVVINLTRKNGAGSLAHEWYHALDNYLAKQDAAAGGTPAAISGPNNRNIRDDYMTGRHRRSMFRDSEALPDDVYQAFAALRDAFSKSGYLRRMKRADGFKAKPYYSDNIEMGARAFEAWVLTHLQERDFSHDFLVNVAKDNGGALPNIQERGMIFPAFSQIMDRLKGLDQFKGNGDAPTFPALPPNSELNSARAGQEFEGKDGLFHVTAVKDNGEKITVKGPDGESRDLTPKQFYTVRASALYSMTDEGKAEARAAEIEAMRRAEAEAIRQKAVEENTRLIDEFMKDTRAQSFPQILDSGRHVFEGDNGNTATFIHQKIVEDGGTLEPMKGGKYALKLPSGLQYTLKNPDLISFAKWADQKKADAEVRAMMEDAKAQTSERDYGTAFDQAMEDIFSGEETDPEVQAENEGQGDPQPEDAVQPGEDVPTEANEPAQAPAPGESVKALKSNLKEALKESGAALNELFGPKMDRLNSGLAFDEETYKKAVPHFKLAFRAYGRAATNLVDLAKGLINYMVQEMGLNREAIGSMRPYFMRFMKDVNEGKIDPYAEDAPAIDADVKAMAGEFAKALANGEAFKTINVARRMASETLGRKLTTADHKAVEEAMELALVKTARAYVSKGRGGSKAETFDALAELYERQPVLAQRTNDSERRQAYSTPAPLAYLASELAGIDRNTTVYEPTAGNGMLLIGANPKLTTANELDGQRAARIAEALGADATVTVGSALDLAGPNDVDVVIENPPFGKLLEENGATPQTFDVPFGKDGKTTEIDQAIAAKTLTAMTDDGKAVLIVGGHQGDAAARVKKYRGTPRAFWNWLYDNYNVTEHFTVSGDLYKRQGAGWPVDVVVIDGRGRSRKALPMAEAPSLYEGWPQLKERLDGTQSTLDPRGERDGGGLSEGGAGSEPDVAGVSDQAGVSDRAPDGEQPNGGEISGADDGGKPVGSRGNTAGASNPDGKPGERAGNAGGDVRGAAQQPGRPVDGQERTGTGSEPGGSSDVQQPNPDGLAGKGSRKPSERVNTEQATSLQVQYAPRSDAKFAVGTLVPKNMQTAMTNALDAIAEEVGDIDEFVAKELGYNTERMIYGDKDAPGYFSAEQVDALALSIHNVKNGAGFIIGDQTGVGKGRVVAAMMRWAERNDRIPVFLTARAGLFNAMVGDMRDIGWDGDPTSDTFVTDQKLRGKDKLDLDSGGVLEAQAPKAYKASMAALNAGNLPDGIKRIFTTYSQVQSVKGKETERRAMLRAIAPKALFILDESHLAGGVNANERVKADDDLSRGKFIRDVLDMSQGAFYSSATFAKSPSVMSLYGKTDLRLAVDDIENLGEVIERGGVPMQQVASNMLVQAGQYARRERSYAGVKFETQQYKTDMAAARGGSEAIRTVFDLDRDVMEEVRKAFIEERKNQGDGGAMDNAVGDESASSIGFSSVMHNVVSQLLTAIKADHAADRVIEIIKSGRKPIIALSNTNESIITDFIGDAADGTEVGNVPFNTILDRYLDRLRRITVKDRNTEKNKHIYLTDKDIIRLGGKRALDQFNAAKKAIAEMKLDGIPGSPLDYILDKVEAAGYKMGEITGRKSSVRNGIVVRKKPSAAINNRTMRAYNGGDIDALIINKSGAEGFSLHATDKTGNDGKPRSMIVLQPDPDINVFMQLIGRIHRTGQIHLPEYEIATSQLAVEKRPAAVLMRKMNSLSANTTANKDSVVELKTVDFMNKYGDQVMRNFLRENPDLAHALDLGSIMESLDKSEDGQDGGALVARVTGRMAVLDPDQADKILTEIEDNYTALIEELDRAGKNDLEAKTVDLDAKTESTSDITDGVPGSSSPFAQPARFEVADVKTFGKPMTTQEVLQAVNDAWGDAGDMRAWRRKAMAEIDGWVKPAEDKVQAQIDKRQERLADAPNESSRQRILDSISALEAEKSSVRSKVNEIESKVFEYAPGRPLTITPKDDPDTLWNGISLGIDYAKAEGNPNAKSKMMVRIAIAAPERELRIPLTSLIGDNSNYSVSFFENMANTAKMFDEAPRDMREKRGIITGNLIAGYEKFPKGRIVMFTRADGSIDQGILMPRNFNLAVEIEKMPVPLKTDQNVLDFISRNMGERGQSYYPVAKTTDGVVEITRNSGGRYIMRIRAKGGRKYTQHSVIGDTIGELSKRGNKEYTATIYSDADAKKILSAFIKDLVAQFQAESYKPIAREIMGIKTPEAKPAKESRIAPEPTAKPRDVTAAVNDEISKAGLDGKVNAKLVGGLTGAAGAPIQGRQSGAQIEINSDSPDAVGVLRHELVHALRDSDLWGKPYGLFTDGEWKALVRALRGRKDITAKIREEYADLNASQRTEEGIAELYREWAAARDASSQVANILAKVQSFLRAVASGLRGTGFNDAARVMEKIAGGEIGGRGQDGGPARNAKGRFTRELRIPPAFSKIKGEAARDKAEGNFISNLLTDIMGGKGDGTNILGLVPGEPLFAELGKNIPSAQRYLRLKHEMGATRNELQARADEVLQDWRKVMSEKGGKEHNKDLADLMHSATIAKLDPAARFTPPKRHKGEPAAEYEKRAESRRGEYDALRERYNALPPEFRRIYRTVRDEYTKFADATEAAILKNIEKSMGINLDRAERKFNDTRNRLIDDGVEGEKFAEAMAQAEKELRDAKIRFGWGKASRLQSLRLQMESNRIEGPYFPLMRFGNYFVTVRERDSGRVVSFSKFESAREQKRFVAEQKKNPEYQVTAGVMDAPGQLRAQIDPNFVADVEQMIGNATQDESLQDEIWQRYLETLPDFSLRKNHIHRKGRAGYSHDAFRVFGRQMFHGAHQLARLQYGLEMQQSIDNAKREADISSDPNRARLVANEMDRRHQWTMNPKSSAWSTWATSAAFVYYLGATPAAAFVNITQTTVVGIPILSAGIDGANIATATRQIARAAKDFIGGRAHVAGSKSLSADEKSAMAEAYRRGTIDKSRSHDLAGIAESGVEYSDIRARIMKPISFLFHHTERANREVTFLAAYRMARNSGIPHEMAIEKATELTWKTHFNYESDARPRLLQQDWIRVAMVFKNYQINLLYRLFRDLHQVFNGASPEDRREARKQLIGITGMMMFHAGITGVWGYALLTTILGMFSDGGSDEVEQEIKDAMVGLFGQDIGGALLKGVPGQLTGVDLTSRIGMPELWFRKPDRQLDGQQEYSYWVEQMLGAVPGMASRVYRGVGLMADGDIYRGVETAAPKAIRDIMKAGRYISDGVTTSNGDPILENVSPAQAIKQALGFTPAQVSERYEMNSRRMNESIRIEDERSTIVGQIANNLRRGQSITPEMMERMRAFNAKHPTFAITAETIKRSVKSRIQSSQRITQGGGVPINPKLSAEIDKKFGTTIYD